LHFAFLKLLRGFFRHRRTLYGEIARQVYAMISSFCNAAAGCKRLSQYLRALMRVVGRMYMEIELLLKEAAGELCHGAAGVLAEAEPLGARNETDKAKSRTRLNPWLDT
jgi:hypothetical protein